MAETDKMYTSVAAEKKKMQLLKDEFDAHDTRISDLEDAMDDAAHLTPDDGSEVIADFDPQADTVWKKEQTLSNAEKTQVQQNLGIPQTYATKIEVNAQDTRIGAMEAKLADLAKLGFAAGICETAADVAAKVVDIPNYILTIGSLVSVYFEKAISVGNPTLNINSTGAKPIRINQQLLQAGVVKAYTTAILQYNGSYFNIASLFELQPTTPADLYVDLGLPSGLKWATRNIDASQPNGFAASPFQYECSFFSWGNIDVHNPTSSESFGTYSFGTGNDAEPYVSSPGAAINYPSSAGLSFDAARAVCGSPWRLPTPGEFAELFNANNTEFIDASGNVIDEFETDDLRTTVNGIVGLYLQSKVNQNRIFFPCSGYGHGSAWNSRGSDGYYWSSSLGSKANGQNLSFGSGGVNPQISGRRFRGFVGRPVQ